ncbi:uncharacterized protein K444DRAFT_287076 [Hyaloscypha bicolor E]|uniref:Cora-domain-containing protein n=1 Tax=Hyaloscypha bicolor E TaxID=1095630 RepID=A0A2J6SGR5_9HELO|nr:uncharacterized protein K444DRAFT_287076 [Hyaloscypha bicolor E]PMD49965.1 hypothetical protein K444DRAFT_287076 [Hyaloscypha bicolor E]
MASTIQSHEIRNRYRERIKRLSKYTITPWPGLESLGKFIENGYSCHFSTGALQKILEEGAACNIPPDISIVNIPGEGDLSSEFSITDLQNPHDLVGRLPSLADNSPSSQLIIIENICSDTLTLLGGYYDIDPQFFAQYTNVLSWYQMREKVPERLTSLPSTRNAEDFLLLRYVSTRELYEEDDASIRARSVIWPDMKNTRLGHSAGRLQPITGPEDNFPPIAFTRQCFSVWCKKKMNCNGWIAIMLLDRPFQLRGKYGVLGPPEYRNPNLRPNGDDEFDGDAIRQSFKKAFCSSLKQRCFKDETYINTCATNTFLALYEGYRIIASEWVVVDEYVKRELANIERHLENKEPTFQELEQHLKELYRIRRRCNKDHELVVEAASQCEKRGQALWPSAKTTSQGNTGDATFAERYAHDLEEDFKYVLANMGITISRIEKDISLLMALVAISEGRQSLRENRGISFLTLVATIFLPSETVATVLGIQTQYGPGARNFWMLWAVALPLTVLVVLIPFAYPGVSGWLNGVRGKYAKKEEKTGWWGFEEVREENGKRDEGVELEEVEVLQTSTSSVV